ncbi:MAG: DAK2 domain-containing protein [Candidatus Eremiobacteraeota bacterium]|nr:DAK2 domain-containing protein [Candidatus Eremiobacteraeota bacterium]
MTALDGRAFSKFVVAGSYLLRKYRGVLNDLNVFPVPDGDTGSNLYLTVVSALREARVVRDQPLGVVAAAAAKGALFGARGNSGVIFSQMLRGFARAVQDRETIDTRELARALREAVAAARAALLRPVEGTILSVADAAAAEAAALATSEPDFYRLDAAVVRAANEALDRTPDQLPLLKEAGVVDSGGAGFVYFLEGILRFLPSNGSRATAYPRRAVRGAVFTPRQVVGENKYCTEFVLEQAAVEQPALRDLLQSRGDSLLVAGEPPTLRVHIHTDDPLGVQKVAAPHGHLTRLKVENMEEQHRLLVVEHPPRAYSLFAIVPGEGFARLARDLGADETLVAPGNPSVREIVLGIRKCLGSRVIVLPNDPNVILAAREAAALSERDAIVVPTRDVPSGLSVLVAYGRQSEDGPVPDTPALEEAAKRTRVAALFFAGKRSNVGGVDLRAGAPAAQIAGSVFTAPDLETLAESAARRLAGEEDGLLTLYYGGNQEARDAERLAAHLRTRLAALEIEWYCGGQPSIEYVVSFER